MPTMLTLSTLESSAEGIPFSCYTVSQLAFTARNDKYLHYIMDVSSIEKILLNAVRAGHGVQH